MLGLMENQLKYENIPNGYELCFNNNCQQRERCLHYQAYRLQPEVRLHGPAIYPAAWASGQCQHFRDVKPVTEALRVSLSTIMSPTSTSVERHHHHL
jgi:hypothetical protein